MINGNQNGSANFEAPGNNKVKNCFNVTFAPVRVRFRLKVFEKKGTYICDKGYKFISLREKQGFIIFRLITFILKRCKYTSLQFLYEKLGHQKIVDL